MEQYITKAAVEISSGALLKLTYEQAMSRIVNLKPLKRDVYEVKRPVRFKAGEVIGVDNINLKPIAKDLDPVKAAKAG
jgi:hypothetical protein